MVKKFNVEVPDEMVNFLEACGYSEDDMKSIVAYGVVSGVGGQFQFYYDRAGKPQAAKDMIKANAQLSKYVRAIPEEKSYAEFTVRVQKTHIPLIEGVSRILQKTSAEFLQGRIDDDMGSLPTSLPNLLDAVTLGRLYPSEKKAEPIPAVEAKKSSVVV
jgi:hypothetical protein